MPADLSAICADCHHHADSCTCPPMDKQAKKRIVDLLARHAGNARTMDPDKLEGIANFALIIRDNDDDPPLGFVAFVFGDPESNRRMLARFDDDDTAEATAARSQAGSPFVCAACYEYPNFCVCSVTAAAETYSARRSTVRNC